MYPSCLYVLKKIGNNKDNQLTLLFDCLMNAVLSPWIL